VQPELFDFLDHQGELPLIGRFAHAAIGVQVVGCGDAFLVLRRGHDDDRNASEKMICFQFGQHLVAVLAGQKQIEQDEVGPGRSDVIAAAEQIIKGGFPILDNGNAQIEVAFLERLDHQVGVIFTVLDQEDADEGQVRVFGHTALSCAGQRRRSDHETPRLQGHQLSNSRAPGGQGLQQAMEELLHGCRLQWEKD